MPLRSVEAATRDDAIAAAREQFGPQARVVGVRRVRSGGVLGFFATERYVAEVAPDVGSRPMVPVPAAGRSSADPLPVSSPLASAAPARARATAPARNGAAAYAAVAGSAPRSEPQPSAAPAFAAVDREPRRSSSADDAQLSELAGLLGVETEPPTPTYSRATFPRATTVGRQVRETPSADLDDEDVVLDDEDDDDLTAGPAVTAAAPSPFTAALARMVSGDRDVRQAVEEALEPTTSAPARTTAGPWPTWSGPIRTAEPSVPSPPARQKEETVGDQVIAPPSMHATRPAEFPAWAAEPDAAAASASSREEAIAEVLRSALAQGHSDEALAGILRKVLAGASPQTALTEPEPTVAPVAGDLALPNVVVDLVDDAVRPAYAADLPAPVAAPIDDLSADTVVNLSAADIAAQLAELQPPQAELPDVEQPVAELPAAELPDVELPDVELPDVELPVADLPAPEPAVVDAPTTEAPPVVAPAGRPLFAAAPEPAPAPVPAQPMWGEPASQSTLWGETVAVPSTPVHSDAPIWAEVVRHEPAPAVVPAPAPVPVAAEAPAVAEPIAETAAAEPVTAESEVVETREAKAEETATVEETATATQDAPEQTAGAVQEALLELAPMLARTASDPAPMSLDATTVMPPLSLLPPLPGMRGRGRPPVPPVVSRSPLPSAAAPTPPRVSTPAPATDRTEIELRAEQAPASARTLATVTRLPVAPPAATPETPEMPEPDDLAGALEAHAVDAPAEPPVAVEGPLAPEAAALVADPPQAVAPQAAAPQAAAPQAAAPQAAAPQAAAPEAAVLAPQPAAQPFGLTELEPTATSGDVVARLEALGVPAGMLGTEFASEAAVQGTYAALTRALALRLAPAPELPTGAGEVLFVVGPGVETLRAARSMAASLRLDPERVQWATRGDLVGLAPESSRMATIDAAIDRRQAAAGAGTVTIVAVDAPMRTDAYWMAQMLAIWSPTAVWAVVEATRKPDDLEAWLAGLSRVDALVVQDTDLSADPAAVLRRVAAPVAILDGVRATPHRWASLLCERLEDAQA